MQVLMPTNSKDRRRHPRRQVREACKLYDPASRRFAPGRTEDVSPGGARLVVQWLRPLTVGDEVNLASRLEGLCKTYAVGIIIGENTWRQASDLATLELDLVMVKGKTEPERIYAVLGDATMAASPEYQTLLDRQAAFLILYRTGSFAECLPVIAECVAAADAVGWRYGYYEIMNRRVEGSVMLRS